MDLVVTSPPFGSIPHTPTDTYIRLFYDILENIFSSTGAVIRGTGSAPWFRRIYPTGIGDGILVDRTHSEHETARKGVRPLSHAQYADLGC